MAYRVATPARLARKLSQLRRPILKAHQVSNLLSNHGGAHGPHRRLLRRALRARGGAAAGVGDDGGVQAELRRRPELRLRSRRRRAWGDNSVSSCRSYSGAKGPGTSAGVFPMALSLSGEGPRWFSTGCQGVLWDPRDPLSYQR